MYRRPQFVVWNRSHSKDIDRSSVVVMNVNILFTSTALIYLHWMNQESLKWINKA
jgi:hypothetical protein